MKEYCIIRNNHNQNYSSQIINNSYNPSTDIHVIEFISKLDIYLSYYIQTNSQLSVTDLNNDISKYTLEDLNTSRWDMHSLKMLIPIFSMVRILSISFTTN